MCLINFCQCYLETLKINFLKLRKQLNKLCQLLLNLIKTKVLANNNYFKFRLYSSIFLYIIRLERSAICNRINLFHDSLIK